MAMEERTAPAPLEGIRVIDCATFIAAPFCATTMAEFGADVIKVELPGVGDPLRRFGTPTEWGDTLVWLSESRNKRPVTLDLRKPEGAELFKQLVSKVDVLCENFQPGTLERWGVAWDVLKEVNPASSWFASQPMARTGPIVTGPDSAVSPTRLAASPTSQANPTDHRPPRARRHSRITWPASTARSAR